MFKAISIKHKWILSIDVFALLILDSKTLRILYNYDKQLKVQTENWKYLKKYLKSQTQYLYDLKHERI